MARYTQDDDQGAGSATDPTTSTTPTQTPGPPGHDPALDFGGTWTQANGQWKFTPKDNNWQAWFQNLSHGQPSTSKGLTDLQQVLTQYGLKVSPPNAQNQTTKIGLPDGSWVRVIDGDPNSGSWSWVVQPMGGGAGGANPGAYQPFNEPFTPPAPFTPPGTINQGGRPGLEFIPPAPKFDFTAPTMEQAAADPGYQFGINQGRQQLEQSAAGRGVLNSGGTLKAIDEYGQNYGTQHYGDFYNRAFNLAQAKFSPVMSEWGTLASAGQRQNELNYSNAWDRYRTDYGNAWDRYLQDYRGWQDWQQMDWNRKFSLATA